MGLVAAAFMVFGRFGWMSKIAGALLGMMIIGNNAQMARNNTAVTSAGGNTQKPVPAQAEDQNVSKGIRR